MQPRVKDFMNPNVIKLHRDDTILKAATVMAQYHFDQIPVVDNQNRIIGIYTKSHALKAIGMDGSVAIGDLMKTEVVTISEDTILEEVAGKVSVRRLPVVNKNGELVGIITRTDTRRFWLQLKTTLEYISAIINSEQNGMVAIDVLSNIQHINKAAERLIGVHLEEAIGKKIVDIIPDVNLTTVMQTGVAEPIQRITLGQTTVLVNRNPVISKGKIIGAVGIFQDISQIEPIFNRFNYPGALDLSEEFVSERKGPDKEPLPANYIYQSASMKKNIETAVKVAQVDTSVLILGESGVGKEQVVKFIHEASNRAAKPFVKVNCASIPANLIESELFGYEGGAFTGANKEGRPGLFETAEGGTLFLDEIGELPIEMQPKLLRVLQEGEILRIGGRKPIKLDVRIIAATNRDIENLVRDGKFREDLFYRLNVISIRIPPLRERKEEIPALIYHFLKKYNLKHDKHMSISSQLTERLVCCEWRGNIRELENTIERMVVLSGRDLIDVDFITDDGYQCITHKEPNSLKLRDALEKAERDIIESVYKRCRSTRKAAQMLGVCQSTIVKKLKKYSVEDVRNFV